jgi:hypothetical protein
VGLAGGFRTDACAGTGDEHRLRFGHRGHCYQCWEAAERAPARNRTLR